MRRAVDDRHEPGQFILAGSATPEDSVERVPLAGSRRLPNGLVVTHIDDGIVVLRWLLEIATKVRVIVAHGGDATWRMKKFRKAFPDFIDERGLVVIETRHTSNRAFIMPLAKLLEAEESIREAYRKAMRLVGVEPTTHTNTTEPQTSPIERAMAALVRTRRSGAAPAPAVHSYFASLPEKQARALSAELLIATIDA